MSRPSRITARSICSACVCISAASFFTAALHAQCSPEWTPVGTGLEGDAVFTNASASAMTVFNDGTGSALYVGGNFVYAGGQTVNRIAKWDGQSWSPLGSGMFASGPASPASVLALTSFNDGTGPALYAGGAFLEAGGVPANRVAKWDGSSWSALGGGITSNFPAIVWSLAVYNDGTGDALYAAGRFTLADGQPANRVAKWNGSAWTPLGTNNMNEEGYGLAVYNDGSGPALYVGGAFTIAGTASASHIAKWNGTTWTALGAGTTSPSGNDPSRGFAQALAVYNGALHVGGRFINAGGSAANNMARWNGTAWSALSGGVGTNLDADVLTLSVGDINSSGFPSLFVGGIFTAVGIGGAVPAANIARWNGTTWSTLGSGTNGDVYATAVYDDGTGPALYVGGNFNTAGGVPVNHIARWGCNPSGACCLPSGTCDVRTNQACITAAGTYAGNSITCAAAPACTPAPTGACCRAAGCIAIWNLGEGGCNLQHGIYRGDSTACASTACPTFEAEPNNSRAEATPATLASGQSVAGFTTGTDTTAGSTDSTTADCFRIRTIAAPPGIYRHRLTLHNEATPGNTALLPIRLQLGDACPAANDITFFFPYDVGQEPDTVGADRISGWYGFGRQEQIYYNITGLATTLTDAGTPGVYTATLDSTPVTPTSLGSFLPGTITITTTGQGHDNDTALAIYDSTFHLIPGFTNDDASTLGGAPADSFTTSFLRRTFAPGTYYLAVGISYLTTSDAPSIPCDDAKTLQVFADFPDSMIPVDSITGQTVTDVSFSIADSAGSTPILTSRAGITEAAWYSFTVAAPSTGVCCRGTTCTTTVPQASCTAAAPIGALFVSSSSVCNTGNSAITPCCYADFNKNGSLQVQDIFDFLNAWFAGSLYAKMGGDGATGALAVQDIFDYLNAWFAGGC